MLSHFNILIGPTHHFGGLSEGNVASMAHGGQESSPKQAALEQLELIKKLSELGVKQIVCPPLIRPHFDFFNALGFEGRSLETLKRVGQVNLGWLSAGVSSSFMWTANAGTMTGLSVTPANLVSNLHRSIETNSNGDLFKRLFPSLTHYPALPAILSDEGAANHTRFYDDKGESLHLFVYGSSKSKTFKARQSRDAILAICHQHKLSPHQVVIAEQHPKAIDAGVFHNDVISVGEAMFFFVHELAFVNQKQVLETLQKKACGLFGRPLDICQISKKDLPLNDVVSSYLFNSILVSKTKNTFSLVAPKGCDRYKSLWKESPIKSVKTVELGQSLNNGGGPACLRMRLPLTKEMLNECPISYQFSEEKYELYKELITQLYPDKFHLNQILDSTFLNHIQDINRTYAMYFKKS